MAPAEKSAGFQVKIRNKTMPQNTAHPNTTAKRNFAASPSIRRVTQFEQLIELPWSPVLDLTSSITLLVPISPKLSGFIRLFLAKTCRFLLLPSLKRKQLLDEIKAAVVTSTGSVDNSVSPG